MGLKMDDVDDAGRVNATPQQIRIRLNNQNTLGLLYTWFKKPPGGNQLVLYFAQGFMENQISCDFQLERTQGVLKIGLVLVSHRPYLGRMSYELDPVGNSSCAHCLPVFYVRNELSKLEIGSITRFIPIYIAITLSIAPKSSQAHSFFYKRLAFPKGQIFKTDKIFKKKKSFKS